MANASVPHTANAICAGIAGAYLVLYSGYDKPSKSFNIAKKLTDIFSFRNPAGSLLELNKALGLTAMSVANAAALCYVLSKCSSTAVPAAQAASRSGIKALVTPLAVRAATLATIHGMFSNYKFFSRYSGPKALAMYLGPVSFAALTLWANKLTGGALVGKQLSDRASPAVSTLAAVAMVLLTSHVFLMERNVETGKLVMRPFGVAGLCGSFAVTAGVVAVASSVCGCSRRAAASS